MSLEIDDWEERAKIVVDKAKAMIRPPRKKTKKKDVSDGGGVCGGCVGGEKEKKDNRPRWARRADVLVLGWLKKLYQRREQF